MNAMVYEHSFAHATSLGEGRVELAYELDYDRWPWLSLPSHHPVLIEKYQYFGAVTAMLAVGQLDPAAFTALSQFEWQHRDLSAELPTQGLCLQRSLGNQCDFRLSLHGQTGVLLAEARGSGVILNDRDVGAWRAKSRKAALAAGAAAPERFAPPASIGCGVEGVSFISTAQDLDGTLRCQAFVPTEGGFHPAHPFHTGSGDHVNAGQLFDCAFQLAHLAIGADEPLRCLGGSARFLRFVELDVPFEIALTDRRDEAGTQELDFAFSQLGRDSARISLRVAVA